MVFQLPDGVARCVAALERAGHPAYLVGGCVRDMLLSRTPGDYDVATAALPEQVEAMFPRTIPTGRQHGTVTVRTEDGPVEVTTFRREEGYADGRRPDRVRFDAGLEEDLSRRDFTVNAMAMDLKGAVTDPFGGRADLAGGYIRCVGDPDRRFAEDGLRLLRGVRFAAQLGFALEEETRAAMGRCSWRAASVAGERVKAEMEKTLLSPAPERVGEMLALGMLAHLHPAGEWDLRRLRAQPPKPLPRWRAFCEVTGFPITALPVARALRRAVLYPEEQARRTLALSGGALAELGLRGTEIGAMQRRLAEHVLRCPEDNSPQALRRLAAELLARAKR